MPEGPPKKVRQARFLRKNMGASENVVWERIRYEKLGFKFRRQHPVGRYILDFYCAEARVALEIDGPMHDPEYDARRDAELASLGIVVLRCPSLDVHGIEAHKLDSIFIELKRMCAERIGSG